MDARKPDPATQSGDRIETRPPEDIFSSLPPEAPVPDGQPRKRSLFARILQVFRLIFVGDAEHEQRPATGMAARLRENFSQVSSAGDKPMTRKELFAALDAPLHGLMPDDINYASEVDAALSRRPAFTARALSVAVALLVVALPVWAAWAPIDEVTHAEGSVVGSRRTQSVSNLEGGILQAVLVREGEVVEKGQVVAQLENVMAESSYRDALYKLVEHRLAIMRLEAMLRDEEPVFPSDLPVFLKEILGEEPDGVLVERARQIVDDQRNTWKAQSSKLRAELSMLEAQYAQRQSEVAEQLARKKQLDGSLVLETEQRDTAKRLLQRNIIDLLRRDRAAGNGIHQDKGERHDKPNGNKRGNYPLQYVSNHKVSPLERGGASIPIDAPSLLFSLRTQHFGKSSCRTWRPGYR